MKGIGETTSENYGRTGRKVHRKNVRRFSSLWCFGRGDLDLAVLGGAPAEFDRYQAGIRAEYAHVSEADYAVGRAAVLTRFLDRPTIFTTATYGDRYEAAARRQLRTAIDRLSRGK